ncbi:cytochrome P450 family protein [Sinosporangium siamense]|uniref:Cytochrome P450 hydroxylase n=1 Tax=Sinosporangium siamense TaxID=1367973 RepID=A0A919RM15_9ACTN|nr:cytochrome P450 [Sinosporangium siamense]GII96053.1 cytochrome P450 hydroxylase [Sinosporangium siamense]
MSVTQRKVPAHVPDSLRDELWSPGFEDNPYPTYSRLRDDAPVHRVPAPLGMDIWLVTRYEDVRQAFNDPRLSRDLRKVPEIMRALKLDDIRGAISGLNMLATDPPDHTRLRGPVAKAFTRRRVELLRPRVQEITDELLDRIPGGEEVDFIGDFAFLLPVTVICELLGVPVEHRDDFRAWSTEVTAPTLTEEGAQRARAGSARLHDYFRDLVGERRPAVDLSIPPGSQPDLVSALIAASCQEERLSLDELVGTLTLLLVAGHETTVNLIGNGLLAFIRHPGQLALLRRRPELMPNAVEEILRYDAPVERSTPRYALEDVEIGGLTIPKGSFVFLVIGSTGRDAGQFAEADDFDITREDNQHIAFGHGVHYCLGAPLARMEGEVAFETLLRRFAKIELARPDEPLALRRGAGGLIRGIVSLPVRLSTT